MSISPERPVCEFTDRPHATEGYAAFYLCEAITQPLFPDETRFGNVEEAVEAIVTGLPPVDESLSTGWDRIEAEERAQLSVELSRQGAEATVAITKDGQSFVPTGMAEDFDFYMELMMPIRWTVFQDSSVVVVHEPLCYPVGASGAACEMRRADFVSNFIPDLAGGDPDCYPWDFWVEERCHTRP